MSGFVDDDDIRSTHLTVLLPLVAIETDVIYGCKIAYVFNVDIKILDTNINVTKSGKWYVKYTVKT